MPDILDLIRLLAAEARHFRTFMDLAANVRGEGAARERFAQLATIEAEIAGATGGEPTVHG